MEAAPVAGRIRGAIMTAIAVGLMTFALFSHTWGKSEAKNRRAMDSLHAGLRSALTCEAGKCEKTTYQSQLDDYRYKTFVTLGAMTFWLGLAAAATLVAALALALAKVPIGAVLSPARIAIVLTGIAVLFGLLFALQKPDFIDSRWIGGFLFCGGGVIGIVGAITLSRWEKTYAMEKAMSD